MEPKERFLWEFGRAMAHLGIYGVHITTPCPNCLGHKCIISVHTALGSIGILQTCGTLAIWYPVTVLGDLNIYERPIKRSKV